MLEEAENFKKNGNLCYKNKDYEKAIYFYDKAIDLDKNNDDFYLNKGLAYKKLNDFDNSIKNAQISIELNIDNIKSHILMGQSLLCISKNNGDLKLIETAIKRLSKALGLCSSQNKKELEQSIENIKKRAKKLKYFIIEFKKLKEKENDFNNLKQIILNDNNINDNIKKNKIKNLKEVFELEKNNHILPDFLKCTLSNKIFEDPVLLPSGYSYEKSYIYHYLKMNNNIDPLGNHITIPNIFENLNLKHYIDYYLEQNPWAFEIENNTIESIQFN